VTADMGVAGSQVAGIVGWAVGSDNGGCSRREQQDLRKRERLCVCDGQQRGFGADCSKASRCAPMKPQLRRAAVTDDLDVAPQDVLGVPGAKRFHRGFLGGEAAGEVDGRFLAAHAVFDFTIGEHAMQEPIAISFNGRRDSRDIRCVETKTDNFRHQRK
jgi:hypothetical protein